ncbi:MAG: carcinine hydrolase/isopenicillin-N N-acyltransferase family protein [Clostridia bacterium]|nr:carcinine hydrolase/isopenicillin-N N-acyltransferase family protein [Clostridia bacterium]
MVKKRVKMLSLMLIFALLVPCCMLFTACCGKEEKMYTNPQKIADYLYSIEYTNYRQDVNLETIKRIEDGVASSSAFGCSSVRNGNFYGRNFDYTYNDMPEFVVRVKKSANVKHESIGVAAHFNLREGKMGSYDKELELVPNLTLDGINDAGVICSHNVVKCSDGGEVTHTNEGKEKLHMLFIPRYVLNNADTAEQAVEMLKNNVDIYGSLNNGEYYLHVMIADANKTYIVEFANNEIISKEVTGDNQIMTNYYLNLPPTAPSIKQTRKYPEHAMGTERYKILQQNYAEATSVAGMQNLMKRVMYANACDLDADILWYSEARTQTQIATINKEQFKTEMTPFVTAYWQARNSAEGRALANPSFWQTVHNSTYDMQNKTLHVFVQEDYNPTHCYTFSL